jgi:hypothetical protein
VFPHAPEAVIVDLAVIEAVDIDLMEVIRFVAMEIIPKERVAQDRLGEKT